MKIKNILLIPMMLFSLASCNNNDNKITPKVLINNKIVINVRLNL